MGPRRPRIPVELAERIDAVRGDVPFERWVRRTLERALGEPSPVFPVVSENLAETPSGEVVAAVPGEPVRYEQQRPSREPSRREAEAALKGDAAVPKIAPRHWAR